MTTFWARTKRRVVATLAIGAAGAAAAYCAYTWYTYTSTPPSPGIPGQATTSDPAAVTSEADAEPGPSRSTDQSVQPSILVEPTGGLETAQMDATAHLQNHFDSIQQIATTTTLPSLLPSLNRALYSSDEVDNSLERLKLAKMGSLPLSSEEKRAVWVELTIATMARAVAAAWALPLLVLQVRIQLNVLGRHLYVETALNEPDPTIGRGRFQPSFAPSTLAPARLSAPSQEEFLSYSEYLAKSGYVGLLAVARRAAVAALHDVPLDAALTGPEMGDLLSQALSQFVGEACTIGLDTFLLPPPNELMESLQVRRPNNRAMMPGADAMLVDVDAVERMVREVGFILGSQRFADVAIACARETSRRLAGAVAARMDEQGRPLARTVPIVLTETSALLEPRGTVVAALNGLAEVGALCATVYSSGI